MTAYLIRRLWQMVPTLFGVVLLVFLLFKGFGGDPAEILGGLNATKEQIEAIRQQLGMDRPGYVQFWIFAKSILGWQAWRAASRSAPVLRQGPLRRLPSTRHCASHQLK